MNDRAYSMANPISLVNQKTRTFDENNIYLPDSVSKARSLDFLNPFLSNIRSNTPRTYSNMLFQIVAKKTTN